MDRSSSHPRSTASSLLPRRPRCPTTRSSTIPIKQRRRTPSPAASCRSWIGRRRRILLRTGLRERSPRRTPGLKLRLRRSPCLLARSLPLQARATMLLTSPALPAEARNPVAARARPRPVAQLAPSLGLSKYSRFALYLQCSHAVFRKQKVRVWHRCDLCRTKPRKFKTMDELNEHKAQE